MELHNNQVPGNTVWALETDFGNGGMWTIEWFLTPETSSDEYRHAVGYMKTHSGGTAKRWKVTLPGQRMEKEDVDLHVLNRLSDDPDGTTQLLDISIQQTKE